MYCPRCDSPYSGRSAISRRDSNISICPTCGLEEAYVDMVTYSARKLPDVMLEREARMKEYISHKSKKNV